MPNYKKALNKATQAFANELEKQGGDKKEYYRLLRKHGLMNYINFEDIVKRIEKSGVFKIEDGHILTYRHTDALGKKYYIKQNVSLDSILDFTMPLFKSCKNGVVYESNDSGYTFRIVKSGNLFTGCCLIVEIYENEVWWPTGYSDAFWQEMYGLKLTSDAAYKTVKRFCDYMEGRN